VTSFWVGVASRDHVMIGRAGGFCQLGHGKRVPLDRLKPGDRLIYYSPRTQIEGGEPVQAFTAIGEVLDGPPRQVDMGQVRMGKGFKPFRRDVRYFAASDAPIRPLLERLAFTRGKPSWGYVLRRGLFAIDADDYRLIAKAMGVTDDLARLIRDDAGI